MNAVSRICHAVVQIMQQLLKNCIKLKALNILAIFLSATFAGTPCGQVTIFSCDDNAIISENCTAVTSENCLSSCSLSLTLPITNVQGFPGHPV